MKLQLIDDFAIAHKFWSVRLIAIGSFLQTIFYVWPESALNLWQFVTPESKAALPAAITNAIPVVCFILAGAARVLKQRKIDAAR